MKLLNTKKVYKYNQDRVKFIRSVKDYQIPTIMKKLVKRDYLDIFEKNFIILKMMMRRNHL